MIDSEKTKVQLIDELVELRKQNSELKKLVTNNRIPHKLPHLFAEVIENMPDGIVIKDLNHRIIYVNSIFEKQTGYSRTELIGKHPSILIGEKNVEQIKQDIENTVHNYQNWCGEIIIKCKDGSTFLAEVEVFPVLINELPLGWVTIQRDITKRKEIETQLEVERKRLFTLLDGLPAVVSLRAPDHTIPYANLYFKKQFGDPGNSPCYSIFHMSNKPCAECKAFRVFDTKSPESWELFYHNGLSYQFHAYPFSDIDNSPLVLVFGCETTEHKLAENKLQAAHQQLIDIIEFLPDATFVIDRDKKVIAWNRAMVEMVGIQKEQIIGKSENAYALPFYGQRVPILIDRVFNQDTDLTEHKYDFLERKGNKLFAEIFLPSMFNGKGAYVCGVASPLFDRRGNIVGAIETICDITERKRAEASLRISEERFYRVFNNSPVPMSIQSFPDGEFLYVNDSMEKFTGYQRSECLGHTPFELNLWADLEEQAKLRKLLLEQGFVRNLEFCSRMKSGEIRIGLFSVDYITISDERCVLCVITDITERKQFEKELFRLDRLDLIGEMAAGIGHEVRNPMTTVRGFLQILGEKADFLKYKEYFELMLGELDRANSIISEFLSLAKNKTIDFEIKNLNTIIKALLPLIQADAMKNDIFLNVELGQTQDLSLNEKEIRQLILNLVRNGLEAMSPQGALTIRTLTDSETVILAVQDQGDGIETGILEKIGTPFLTTKENGTGLGLAVCYSIAARHNAIIEIETGSCGTTFFVGFKV